MFFQTIHKGANLLIRHPALWIPGIYAGIIIALVFWLELNDGLFIAGRILFLAMVAFPFLLAGVLSCLSTGDYTLKQFFNGGKKFYFPLILPPIVLALLILVIIVLLAIPFSIAGQGSDPAMMGGLMLGVTIPALIFALYYDNAAVSEGSKVFASLKRSMELFGSGVMTTIGYLFTSLCYAVILAFAGATVWGIILAGKFEGYLDMSMQEQQEIFSGFDLAAWKELLGPDGIAATAAGIGLYLALLIPFLIVFKYLCYLQLLQRVESTPQKIIGEYDEKGRWYKY